LNEEPKSCIQKGQVHFGHMKASSLISTYVFSSRSLCCLATPPVDHEV
jgi:hypothetical protein